MADRGPGQPGDLHPHHPAHRDAGRHFVCNCDEVAFNVVELLKRRGYRVPQDVAVTGYDDFRYSTICSPPLTTHRVDVDEMARTVVAQLCRKNVP